MGKNYACGLTNECYLIACYFQLRIFVLIGIFFFQQKIQLQ